MKKTGFVLLVLAGVFLLMNTGPGISQAAIINLTPMGFDSWSEVTVNNGVEYNGDSGYSTGPWLTVGASITDGWVSNSLQHSWTGDGTSSASIYMNNWFEGGYTGSGDFYAGCDGYMDAEYSFSISPEFGGTGQVLVDFSADGFTEFSGNMDFAVHIYDGSGAPIFSWDNLSGPSSASAYLDYDTDYIIFANMTGTGDFSSSGPSDFSYENFAWLDIDTHEVPIPGALWLLGSGLIGLAGLGRKSAV